MVEQYRWPCANFLDICLIILIGDLINMHAICKKLYDWLISSLSSKECSSSYGGSAYEGNTSGMLRMLSKYITIYRSIFKWTFHLSIIIFQVANKLYPLSSISLQIEEFAKEKLLSVVDSLDSVTEGTENSNIQWKKVWYFPILICFSIMITCDLTLDRKHPLLG